MPTTEPERFAALIEPHLSPLYRAAYRLCRNAPDAEDLVQEVCLRAYDRRAQLQAAGAPRSWLLRVQYHLHVDRARRRGRVMPESLDDPQHAERGHASTEAGPDLEADAARLAERLSEAWQLLTPDQQALLALQAEGYTLAEMTVITGVPLGALKARLHRARVRLGKLLDTHSLPPRMAANSGDSR